MKNKHAAELTANTIQLYAPGAPKGSKKRPAARGEDDEEGATASAFLLPAPAALTTAAGIPSRSPACGYPIG